MINRILSTPLRVILVTTIAVALLGLAGCELLGLTEPEAEGPVLSLSFAPPAGSYFQDVSVSLTSDAEGASIVYSTDGSEPTIPYGGTAIPLTMPTTGTQSVTVRAVVTANGERSAVTSATYELTAVGDNQVQPPTFWPPAGTYGQPQTVTLASATPAAILYYTTDGTAPTTSSTPYTGAFSVPTTMTIKALAVDGDGATGGSLSPSPVATAEYVADPEAPINTALEPLLFPDPGTYTDVQVLNMVSRSGSPIYYTLTSSTDPTVSPSDPPSPTAITGRQFTGSLYLGRTNLSPTGTLQPGRYRIKAISAGVADGTTFLPSPVVSEEYILNLSFTRASSPTFSPAAGTVTSGTTVTVSRSAEDSPLRTYYTTDGTDPLTSSTRVEFSSDGGSPALELTINTTTTIKAFVGLLSNETVISSGVVTATYTVN